MLLCADAAAASADLAGGLLACPSCGTGRLKRWGHGRERVIRLPAGATARLRPDRARCRSCGRTHIVLPSGCASRRADAIEVIGTALAAALGGAGPARIGADLGVPPGTVRGWLRRLRSRAEEMRGFAMRQLGCGKVDMSGPDRFVTEPQCDDGDVDPGAFAWQWRRCAAAGAREPRPARPAGRRRRLPG